VILHDRQDTVSLAHFGILIPVHYSKAGRTLEELTCHPELEAGADELIVPTGPEEITRMDLQGRKILIHGRTCHPRVPCRLIKGAGEQNHNDCAHRTPETSTTHGSCLRPRRQG